MSLQIYTTYVKGTMGLVGGGFYEIKIPPTPTALQNAQVFIIY